MEITYTGRHASIDEKVKEYAEKKIVKFERYFDRILSASVVFNAEKSRHMVEIHIITNTFKVSGKDNSADFFSAIDLVVDKIEKQLKKYKEKLKSKKLHKEEKIRMQMQVLSNRSFSSETPGPEIIKTHKFALKPMSPEEAVMEMDLLGNNFLVFLNANSEQVNVIYRRYDGNYGLVEPEL